MKKPIRRSFVSLPKSRNTTASLKRIKSKYENIISRNNAQPYRAFPSPIHCSLCMHTLRLHRRTHNIFDHTLSHIHGLDILMKKKPTHLCRAQNTVNCEFHQLNYNLDIFLSSFLKTLMQLFAWVFSHKKLRIVLCMYWAVMVALCLIYTLLGLIK